MKTLLTSFKNVQGLDSGPLCRHIQPYIAHVHEQGYKLKTIRYHLRLMANFNRWLVRTGRGLRDLDERTIDAFLPRLLGQRTWRAGERPALLRMLGILRKTRATPQAKAVQLTAAQALATQYRQYLTEERGCSDWTVENYSRHIDRFLARRFGVGPVRFEHCGYRMSSHLSNRKRAGTAAGTSYRWLRGCGRFSGSCDIAATSPPIWPPQFPQWLIGKKPICRSTSP